jgi:RimJ/RimL family protein N-acetyltransferase
MAVPVKATARARQIIYRGGLPRKAGSCRVKKAGSTRLEVKVRRARVGDLDQFAKIVQSVADEGRYIFVERVTEERKESMRRLFKDRGCLVIVAEVVEGGNRKLVGNLTLTRYGDVEKSKHVRVLGMLVVDGYREMGIGTKLIAYALRWARLQKGVEKLSLGVFSKNGRAFRLYEKFGFEVEGVRKRHYYIAGEPQDEIDMALLLK